MEATYYPHEHRVLCTKTLIHIGSLRIPTSGIIWLGRIILFFITLLFAGLGFFYRQNQNTSVFYFYAYFGGKSGPYYTKENLKGKVNVTGSSRCLCCFLFSWLDALIFLTNWMWALYTHCISTGYTAFIYCNSTWVKWFLPYSLKQYYRLRIFL